MIVLPTDRSHYKQIDPSINRSTDRPINPSTDQPIDLLTNQPIDPSIHQPINPLTRRPITPSTHRPMDPSIHRPINPSTHRPIDIDQSCSRSSVRLRQRSGMMWNRNSRRGMSWKFTSCKRSVLSPSIDRRRSWGLLCVHGFPGVCLCIIK